MMNRRTAEKVRFGAADPASAEAVACLQAYFAELDSRFSAGFDRALSISADAHELREPEGVLVLAWLDGTPIGCGALKFHSGAPAELKRMWLDASCRGLGVGRRLLAELERRAAERGVGTVRLETNRSLTEAIALYRSCGYEEVDPFNDESYAHHWFEKHIHVAAFGPLLNSYRVRSAQDAADLDRLRGVVAGGDPWNRATPIHVTSSALVVDPESRRVLLRWHDRQQAWLQVGGHGDPGEIDPVAIAQREAREETGLVDLSEWSADTSPLHVVVVPVVAKGAEPAHEHIDVRYLFTTDSPAAAEPESEDAPLRWLSFDDARATTPEDNLKETLRRAEERLS